MAASNFAPGFRLSSLDVFVLVGGTVGVTVLFTVMWWYSLVVGLVLAHFFLFCNVFRVSRPLELLWASVFVVLAGATILWGLPGWWATAIGAVCVAALVVAMEMSKPSYHGVGWRRINPGLPAWWEARTTKVQDTPPNTATDSGA